MPMPEYDATRVGRHIRGGLLVMGLYVLLVSHDIAWLNPCPGQPPTARPSPAVPFGWEYNLDTGLELYSSIGFPDGMVRERLRIARPLKCALVSAGIDLVDAVHPLTAREKLGVAYALHHLMVFAVLAASCILLFRLAARHRVPLGGILFGWTWLIFNEPVRWGESHTFIFQVFDAIFLLAVLQRLADLRTAFTGAAFQGLVFLYAFLAGFLLLVKQDLAPFVGLFAFAAAKRLWRYLPAFAAGLALPYLLYRGLLCAAGIPWYNHEAQAYGQAGGWFLASLRAGGLAAALADAGNLLARSLAVFYATFGLLVPLAAVGAWAAWARRPPDTGASRPDWAPFLLLGAFIQIGAANRPLDYMFYDAFPSIACLAAIGGERLQSACAGRFPLRAAAILYLAAHGVLKLNAVLHLPWRNPLTGGG